MFLCIISQMFAKFKFRKSVNSDIWQTCQIATFTLFPNLSFPNISEMMQTDVPLVIYNTINTCLKHSGWHKMTTYQQLWKFFSMHGKKFPWMENFFPYMEKNFHAWKKNPWEPFGWPFNVPKVLKTCPKVIRGGYHCMAGP